MSENCGNHPLGDAGSDVPLRYRALVEELMQGVLTKPFNWDVGGDFKYANALQRFTSQHYHPGNSAALCEICFALGIAGTDGKLTPPIGFDESIPIKGNDPITGLERTFAYLFVSRKLNMVVLVFIATQTMGDLIGDFDFTQVPPTTLAGFQLGMLVDSGFYRIFLTVQKAVRQKVASFVKKGTQFIISGYSLGGALATLASFDLLAYTPIVYTYGSPRVGNLHFTKVYNAKLHPVWRVTNLSDVVTDLPFPVLFGLVYEHVGNPVVFTMHKEDILSNHIMVYLNVIIERQFPENPNGICPNLVDCSSKK